MARPRFSHNLELKVEEEIQTLQRQERITVEDMLHAHCTTLEQRLDKHKVVEEFLEGQLGKLEDGLIEQKRLHIDPASLREDLDALRTTMAKLPLREVDDVKSKQHAISSRLELAEQSAKQMSAALGSKQAELGKELVELKRTKQREDDARAIMQSNTSEDAVRAAMMTLEKHSWSEREHFEQACTRIKKEADAAHSQLASRVERHHQVGSAAALVLSERARS